MSSRPACERWNRMRRSSPKSQRQVLAPPADPLDRAPTSDSGGGSTVFSPENPSGSYALERRARRATLRGARRAPASGASGIRHVPSCQRRPRRGSRRRSRAPCVHSGPLPQFRAGCASFGSRGRTARTASLVLLQRRGALGQRPEVFFERERPSPAYCSTVMPGKSIGGAPGSGLSRRFCMYTTTRPSSPIMCHSYTV